MMFIQNSYKDENDGALYVVPTPIGNLDDMTFRAVDLLAKVDLIVAEDTRRTKKLLHHFTIHQSLLSYHEHNRDERIPLLLEKIKRGERIALVSDAGTPCISDPGFELVDAVIKEKFPVIVLPGANAAISALVGSGLPMQPFLFYGFLPRKKRDLEAVFEQLRNETATLIFYESPNRMLPTLQIIGQQLGERHIVIARELTKVYEQYIRGTVSEVIESLQEHSLRGECVLVVAGADEADIKEPSLWWAHLSLADHVQHYEEEQRVSHKEAMKLVAKDRQLTRREVYHELHVKK